MKTQKPSKTNKNKKYLLGAAGVFLVMLLLIFVSANTCYDVTINGEHICYVNNQSSLSGAIDNAAEQISAEYGYDNVIAGESLQVDSVHKFFANTINGEELTELLYRSVDWRVAGAVIRIAENDTTLSFRSIEDGQAVLDSLKNKVLAATDPSAEILNTYFHEDVVLEEANVNVADILSGDDALALIAAGKEAVKIHKVEQGESLWTIARANDTTVTSLKELNPGLDESKIQIGQELQLTKIEPLINVVVDKIVTVAEEIPYGETVKESASLLKGESEVTKQGAVGEKQVTYQISESNGTALEKVVLKEVVTKEPVNKIVTKGTATVASASRGGSGALNWPISGNITSPYGYRSSGFHSGIDIGSKTGTPIYAAAGGKVTLASYSGAYGYCVIIDHGNGMKTRYAHLSKIQCKVGQTLLRGEQLGLVGSTGRSTGPHLHFEVIINGSTKNPVNYLK